MSDKDLKFKSILILNKQIFFKFMIVIDLKKTLLDSHRGSTISVDHEVEEYFFLVNRWFAKDEDDRQIVREVVPTDEKGRPLIELDGLKINFLYFFFYTLK